MVSQSISGPQLTMRKALKPSPADIEIDVDNPRYEGATPLMVARALLQRPKKDDDQRENDDPAAEDADSPT